MEMAHIAIFAALEWVYDKIEERFGKLAAWLVTLGLSAATIAAIVAALIYVLR